MKPNAQNRALDEGVLEQDISLSSAKLLSSTTPSSAITDHYLRFDGVAQESSAQYDWPDIGKGIGVDVWIRFRPCSASVCSVLWLKEFFIIKIDSFKRVSCETLDGEGKLVLPAKIPVATDSSEFSHVACRYYEGALQLWVDGSVWSSKEIGLEVPSSLMTAIAGKSISIPGVEKPFDGDLAGLRIWNDAQALKNAL